MTTIDRALLLSLGLATAACVGDEPSEPVEMPPATEAPAANRTSGWTDLDVVPYEPSAQPSTRRLADVDRPLAARTREELAEALRPVILRGDGKLYIASEPNWAAADALVGDGVDRAEAPREGGVHDAVDGTEEVRTTAKVIGTDGRTRVTDTTIAPFSAIARVSVVFDSGFSAQCSGAYVGPWTFILAGHCLRQPNGTVARWIRFEPGRNGSSLPFGGFTCRNDDSNSSNDFLAAIPSGFVSNPNDHAFDFAVIDTYPCHLAPHWFGEPATNQGVIVDSGTATYSMHGYPGDPCPGASSGFYFMCGMSGTAYVNGTWLESAEIDTSGGQSGGPWYRAGRVAGVHVDYREYFDFLRCGFDVCRRNYARRIDGTFKAFLDAIAFDYP